MNTYNFNTNELNTFRNTTDYSKMLNDIIVDDVIKKNDYLFKALNPTSCIKTSSILKDDTAEFIKAANFLANYKKTKKNKLNFIIGKTYFLMDGTPIIFYDDEIQIGFDLFKYEDFDSSTFIQNLDTSTKKIIIDIYTNTDNLKINIKL